MNHNDSRKVSKRSSLAQAIDMKTKEELRRDAPSPAPSEDNKALTPHEIKRRAQNRASQRAFRKRKRTQVETLQQQVQETQQVHDRLLASYHDKEEEVAELYVKIQDLEFKIHMLRGQNSTPPTLTSPAPFQFEPVLFDDPFDRWSAALFQTPMEWSPQFQQPLNFPMDSPFHLAH